MEGVVVDANLNWDEEAIARAISQAQEVEEWDPDTAKQLMAQAQAAKQKLGQSGPISIREPYDPSALQARVLRHYNGGVTVADLDKIHYKRFFALVRELNIMLEEENKQTKNPPTHNNTVDVSQALNDIPKPQEYDGEVIRLI